MIVHNFLVNIDEWRWDESIFVLIGLHVLFPLLLLQSHLLSDLVVDLKFHLLLLHFRTLLDDSHIHRKGQGAPLISTFRVNYKLPAVPLHDLLADTEPLVLSTIDHLP